MYKTIILLSLCLILIACNENSSNDDNIDSIYSWVIESRQLEPTSEISTNYISPEDFRERINNDFNYQYYSETLQAVYVMLDFMTSDQSLYEMFVDVLSRPNAAIYDSQTSAIDAFFDESSLNSYERVTLAHECVHALQDQHFDLNRLIEEAGSTDRVLALKALVEGDAVCVEMEYAMDHYGVTYATDLLDESVLEAERESFKDLPLCFSARFDFPYEYGPGFVDNFTDYKSLNSAYSDPPKSSEQILHPEKYFDPNLYDLPQELAVPDISGTLGDFWINPFTDVLGEYMTKLYLETYLSTDIATQASEGWGGDYLAYFVDQREMDELIIMYSTWDTSADSEEFFNAYLKLIHQKSNGEWIDKSTDSNSGLWYGEDLVVFITKWRNNILIIQATNEQAFEIARHEILKVM